MYLDGSGRAWFRANRLKGLGVRVRLPAFPSGWRWRSSTGWWPDLLWASISVTSPRSFKMGRQLWLTSSLRNSVHFVIVAWAILLRQSLSSSRSPPRRSPGTCWFVVSCCMTASCCRCSCWASRFPRHLPANAFALHCRIKFGGQEHAQVCQAHQTMSAIVSGPICWHGHSRWPGLWTWSCLASSPSSASWVHEHGVLREPPCGLY